MVDVDVKVIITTSCLRGIEFFVITAYISNNQKMWHVHDTRTCMSEEGARMVKAKMTANALQDGSDWFFKNLFNEEDLLE